MDFWDVFWLLLIFIPLLLIWAFAVVDIFRRDDLAGWAKALWMIVVILAPFLGTIIYLIFRPAEPSRALELLYDLHKRGKLTDEEYEAEKERLSTMGR
jgi:hypothetical protein